MAQYIPCQGNAKENDVFPFAFRSFYVTLHYKTGFIKWKNDE
jgi:hypothetical protein